jgi:hypothetical protein
MDYRKVALATITAFSAFGLAPYAAAAPTDTSGAALTIYNENFAVVRDTIPLDLKSGINQLSYSGITAQVEADSVILRDPAGKRSLSILEQNYRGDTVSQGLMLSLNEGKTIDFQVPGVNGAPPTIVQGKIIRSGYNPGVSVYNQYGGYNPNQPDYTPLIEVDGKLQFSLPGLPLFPALADDSILNPTLDWTIYSDKAGPLNAELAYVTEGMTWNAAYNVVAPEEGSNLDLTAWVTVQNNSGKQFNNARIKLMAGDLNKIAPAGRNNFVAGGFAMDSLNANVRTTATQQAFDEYHLYTLPNATTLRNRETKQVQFLHAENVASKELFVYDGAKIDPNQYNGWSYENIRNQREYGTEFNTKVSIERDFENTEANHLGVPLPAGQVRFYRRDKDGQLEFIGENKIDHTPQDETVKIVTGNAFDLIGSRTQTNYFIDIGHQMVDESFSIVVTNHKKTPADITIVEHLYRGLDWTITSSSVPFVKKNSSTINLPVTLPAGGSQTVTYTAHYTW